MKALGQDEKAGPKIGPEMSKIFPESSARGSLEKIVGDYLATTLLSLTLLAYTLLVYMLPLTLLAYTTYACTDHLNS